MTLHFKVGDTVEIPWQPRRPEIRVTEKLYDTVRLLRAIGITAARRRSTVTYGEAEVASDWVFRGQGGGPALDLLTYDCEQRGEPSLACLFVRKDSGEVGTGFANPERAADAREACFAHDWGRQDSLAG